MAVPNFFIIGKRKSGTTALGHFVRQHPDVYLPEREMHHFESDLSRQNILTHRCMSPYLRSRFNVTLADYLTNYRDVAGEEAVGDRTPSYLSSVTSAAEIHHFNPQAKIIALFREPVSFLQSLHSQNLYDLYETEEDLATALALEDQRRAEACEAGEFRHALMYSELVRYGEQLERFLKYFPAENVLCIRYETFKADNAHVVEEVFRFLEVAPSFEPRFRTVNARKRRRFVPLKRFVSSVARTGIPQVVIPDGLYRPLARRFQDLTTSRQAREPASPEFLNQLRQQLRPDVQQFDELINDAGIRTVGGSDFVGAWGYES